MSEHIQVVRARRESVRVESQSKAAVGELAAKCGRVRVTEAQFRIVHRRCVGWDIHEQLHTIDAAALDTLGHVRARVYCVAHDQEVAVGMQLLTGPR